MQALRGVNSSKVEWLRPYSVLGVVRFHCRKTRFAIPMKLPPFSYCAPRSLHEALDELRLFPQRVRVLAGGQSLLPAMNMRLSMPDRLLDINRLPELQGISVQEDRMVIGAMTRHAEIMESREVHSRLPMLHAAARHIAHPAIRSRGTLGGSLALADPAAEWPACCLVSDAVMIVQSVSGERRIPAVDFFLGMYETALRSDELLKAVEFHLPPAGDLFFFDEIAHRQGDFAMAGIAARTGAGAIRAVMFGVSDRPVDLGSLLSAVVPAVGGSTGKGIDESSIDGVINRLPEVLQPMESPHCSASLRLHYAGLLLRRAVKALFSRTTQS